MGCGGDSGEQAENCGDQTWQERDRVVHGGPPIPMFDVLVRHVHVCVDATVAKVVIASGLKLYLCL
jgi:hypothetical protein